MLQFHTIGFATEKSLLSSPDDSKDDPLELEIISNCLKQGMTVRQIASELHIPNTTVHRRIRQIKAQQNL
jgi:DNA-binding NarL/FixJ family response regulator